MKLNRVLSICLAACAVAVPSDQTKTAPPGAREVVPVSANWRFQIDVTNLGENRAMVREGTFDRSAGVQAAVPKAWDLFDEALWGYEGIGWYADDDSRRAGTQGQGPGLKFGRSQLLFARSG